MLAGQTMDGFSTSLTVTVKLQVDVLPESSVAVEVTLVVPTGKAVPEGGSLLIVTSELLSVAVTL